MSSPRTVIFQDRALIKKEVVGPWGTWTSVPSTRHFNPWSLSLEPAAVSMMPFSTAKCSVSEGSHGHSVTLPLPQV